MSMRPYIVEFTGTPEAGKTTTIKKLIPLLSSESNYKVDYVREYAEVVPSCFPKASFEAHLWMTLSTMSSILTTRHGSSDIFVVDRGTLDNTFFCYKYCLDQECSKEEYDALRTLLSIERFFAPDMLVVMTTSPEESIARRGGEGRFVTLENMRYYNKILEDFLNAIPEHFSKTTIFRLDTTNLNQDEVVKKVLDQIALNFSHFKNMM